MPPVESLIEGGGQKGHRRTQTRGRTGALAAEEVPAGGHPQGRRQLMGVGGWRKGRRAPEANLQGWRRDP